MVYVMAGNRFSEQTDSLQYRIQGFAFVLSSAVCMLVSAFLAFSYFNKLDEQSQIVLGERINPNNATVASLVRLVGIGLGRAEAIVAYREQFAKAASRRSFKDCSDMQKVRGIGPKTAETICEWLTFD